MVAGRNAIRPALHRVRVSGQQGARGRRTVEGRRGKNAVLSRVIEHTRESRKGGIDVPTQTRKGRLLAVGGHERRDAESGILRSFVEMSGGEDARLIVCAVAMEDPGGPLGEYERVFRSIGAAHVHTEPFGTRASGTQRVLLDALDEASGVFFTGGDQLQITSVMAGTRFGERLRDRYEAGEMVIGGTSAGAAAMGGTMIIGGADPGTVRRGDVDLAPGMGYWRDVVVDTHFNQRGRVHRLMVLFAENPQVLGVGLDEDTAVEVVPGERFHVLGSGAAMVFDGRVTHSNTAQVDARSVLALTDGALHVLPAGYGFDLRAKRPLLPSGEAIPGERRSTSG